MPADSLFFGIYFLFFFQLLSEFIAAIYAFGLLTLKIPPELGAVVFLLSPLVWALRPRASRRWLEGALMVMVVSRLALPWLSTRWELWVAGVGVAAGMFALPALLRQARAADAAFGLGLAVAASGLFRALGAGVDVSLAHGWQIMAWVLVSVAGWAWHNLGYADDANREPSSTIRSMPYLWVLGLASVIFLLFAAYTAPAVVARWAAWPPRLAYITAAMALLVWGLAAYQGLTSRLPRHTLAAWLALNALLLGGGLAYWQTPFPSTPAAYPFPRPFLGFAWPLWLALLLFPVLLFAFYRLTATLQAQHLSMATLGQAWGIGGLYLLLLILAHVFTTTYDYIPVVGPLWRDRFWLVYAIPASVATWAVWRTTDTRPMRRLRFNEGGLLAALALGMALAAWVRVPRPNAPPSDSPTLRVVTYNIQQGYRRNGQKGWEDQLAVLRALAPDIVALQESDTARLSGANNDLVGYFATALNMNTAYGPPTVDGTFGIALLSRMPITAARTIYLYSQGEQTALIVATIVVNGKKTTIAVTHLGNNGPQIQQKEVLAATAAHEPLILLGDFNFRPGTPQYRLTLQTLHDANPTPAADEIDHIFVSPDIQVMGFGKVDAPASDHPVLWAVLHIP